MSNIVAKEQLQAFVERAERLHRERAEIDETLKELFAEVKGNGFDLATFKDVLKLRREDAAARSERTALLDLYLGAVG